MPCREKLVLTYVEVNLQSRLSSEKTQADNLRKLSHLHISYYSIHLTNMIKPYLQRLGEVGVDRRARYGLHPFDLSDIGALNGGYIEDFLL